MQKYMFILITVILSIVLITAESNAQRRGGGGFGGGAARPSVNRSPSMSRPSPPAVQNRPSPRPSTPSIGQNPAARPGAGKRPSSLPEVGQRPVTRPGGPVAGNRPGINPGKIKNNIKPGERPSMPDWFQPGATPPKVGTVPTKPGTSNRPGGPGAGDRPVATPPIADGRPGTKPPGTRPPGTGDRPVATPPIADGRPGTKPPGTRPPGTGDRPVATPPIADGRPGGHPPGYPPPPHHPWYPSHPNYHDHHHWWKWATAGAITGWVVNTWANPIYYRYGTGGNVYYDDDIVYVNGVEYGSAEQYYEEAAKIASSVPEKTEEQTESDDWMPLGVFALTKEGINATNMYLQLAIRKDGLIGGTFYNESTGVSHPLEGMVDEKTQRAVWKAADGTNPNLVMETGIYNLSQNQSNVLIHFGPEETQEALLVRMEEGNREQQ